MGQSHSGEAPRQLSTEQLSHELALRFASKCFTHLEIAHFKDNFKALADHQNGIEYWKEETFCRFLCLPDAIQVGSVIYQMATYLGAFPFPSLAPCILTREATIKVVTIMTERYGRVLKRGKKDRVRLLFRSLAVFDRTAKRQPVEWEKASMEQRVAEQKPDDMVQQEAAIRGVPSHAAGFAIDQPVDDDLDEDEDDDELALAALDSLDAIEVFKQDPSLAREKKIHQAQIPVENFTRFLLLLLVLAPLGPQENMANYAEDLTEERIKEQENEAACILEAFDPDEETKGIRYTAFTRAVSSSFPLLFDPLNALFEHFLFSKNIDLSRHRDASISPPQPATPPKPNLIMPDSSNQSSSSPSASILTPALTAHLSTFLITKPSPTPTNLFHSGTRFHPIYSTTTHGTSLTSFSHHVLSWQSATLLLITGTAPLPSSSSQPTTTTTIKIGAYLPTPWSSHPSSLPTTSTSTQSPPLLFLLSPRHALFPHNPSTSTPTHHFHPATGLSLGCTIPPPTRSSSAVHPPTPGPISLHIDPSLSTAIFHHDATEAGSGAFLPDPGLARAQARRASGQSGTVVLGRKIEFEIDTLEVWGVVGNPEGGGEGGDEVTRQGERLRWEEEAAERRARVNFGKDKEGARWLLEAAGLVGGK